MKVMLEGRVTAWCYVDTGSGEVELVEVWAWDEELQFEDEPCVIAEDGGQGHDVTDAVRSAAARIAFEQGYEMPMRVAFSSEATRLERTARGR